MSGGNQYETALDKNQANHTPLSTLSFIARAAKVYPDHPAVIHGDRRYSWAETYRRARQLASALKQRGVEEGDTVSFTSTGS